MISSKPIARAPHRSAGLTAVNLCREGDWDSWAALDADTRYSNSHFKSWGDLQGFAGTSYIAIPEATSGSRREYFVGKITDFVSLQNFVLHLYVRKAAGVYLPRTTCRPTAFTMDLLLSYTPLYYGAVEHADGTFELREGLDASVWHHAALRHCLDVRACYSEKKDSHKKSQNKRVAEWTKTFTAAQTAVVLDAEHYRTTRKLLSKCADTMTHIVVPNISLRDVERMQEVPAHTVLLPNVRLLTALQHHGGELDCLVADSCGNFDDEMADCLRVAFSKFSDRAVLSVTMCTRTCVAGDHTAATLGRLDDVLRECLLTHGFRWEARKEPVAYGNHMLFFVCVVVKK
jgi:hypothetical protein